MGAVSRSNEACSSNNRFEIRSYSSTSTYNCPPSSCTRSQHSSRLRTASAGCLERVHPLIILCFSQLINTLRSELQEQQEARSDQWSTPETWRNLADKPLDDAQVFHSIKERVIEEFGLPRHYVDILYSAQARFPDDEDVINSAGYLKFNRSKQGVFSEGDVVPMHKMPLVSLDGTVATLADRLAQESRPVVLVAGSIT